MKKDTDKALMLKKAAAVARLAEEAKYNFAQIQRIGRMTLKLLAELESAGCADILAPNDLRKLHESVDDISKIIAVMNEAAQEL